MRAIGYTARGDAAVITDLELPDPVPGSRDLLVQVRAISVNPVDTKVRRNTDPEPGLPKVLGWDAAGVVQAVGDQVSGFTPGDEVWYAGSRSGRGRIARQLDGLGIGGVELIASLTHTDHHFPELVRGARPAGADRPDRRPG